MNINKILEIAKREFQDRTSKDDLLKSSLEGGSRGVFIIRIANHDRTHLGRQIQQRRQKKRVCASLCRFKQLKP